MSDIEDDRVDTPYLTIALLSIKLLRSFGNSSETSSNPGVAAKVTSTPYAAAAMQTFRACEKAGESFPTGEGILSFKVDAMGSVSSISI
jgi:hypothetical protein